MPKKHQETSSHESPAKDLKAGSSPGGSSVDIPPRESWQPEDSPRCWFGRGTDASLPEDSPSHPPPAARAASCKEDLYPGSVTLILDGDPEEFSEVALKWAIEKILDVPTAGLRILTIKKGSTIVSLGGAGRDLSELIEKLRDSQAIFHEFCRVTGLQRVEWELDGKRYELSLASLTRKISILFTAANPSCTPRLSLEAEARAIEEAIRQASRRDAFEFHVKLAATPADLEHALLVHSPTIVHFSGHSNGAGIVLHETDHAEGRILAAEHLERLLSVFKKQLRVVVLSACHTDEQATLIANAIDCVVGVRGSAHDCAVRSFSASFYRGLCSGLSVQDSFNLGLLAIEREGFSSENGMPVLCARDPVRAEKLILDG